MVQHVLLVTEIQLRAIVRTEVEAALTELAGRALALLDRQQLARALAVSVPTVDRLRRKGMPTIWVVEAPRFDLRAVLDWLGQLKRPKLRAV